MYLEDAARAGISPEFCQTLPDPNQDGQSAPGSAALAAATGAPSQGTTITSTDVETDDDPIAPHRKAGAGSCKTG
jgi:hypothetical protein